MEAEQVDVEEKAIRYIAKAADGSMRDALSLLDQCIAFYLGQKLTYDNVLEVLGAVDTDVFSRLLRKIIQRDVAAVLNTVEELVMQGRELSQLAADFTWYLRNLLLVKTSDSIEDVLDVSTENLQQLKEEAQMIETDMLLRYIRIFSELSGQMKYATQKRVLLEVALIKLCTPAMETMEDSLLDRIRAVEEKLEKGIAVMPEGGYGISDPVRTTLKKARLSLGGENRLMVVLPEGIEASIAGREDHVKELEALIEQRIGKKVEVEVRQVEEGRRFDDTFVDIEKKINMEITVED